MVSDLDAAAHAAVGLQMPLVVTHDVGREQLAFDALDATFRDSPDVRHVVITRGRRRRARAHGPTLVLLDGDALRRNALLRAVAVAAGRASPEFIHEDVADLLEGSIRTAPTVEAAREQGRLILVAEDDAINQKVIRQQLSLLGYAMEIADNGVQALTMWREGNYAMLITDLHMPEMDGYDLARAIRAEESGQDHLPIIALSANALRGEQHRAFACGVDEYLTKPASLKVLRAVLQKWSKGDEEASALPVGAEPVEPDSEASHAVFEVERLRALVGDDVAMVCDFLVEFCTSARSIELDLRKAIELRDAGDAASLAHRLKSSSRAVGAMKLADLCAGMESAARRDDGSRLEELLPAFSRAREELDEAIGSFLDKGGS